MPRDEIARARRRAIEMVDDALEAFARRRRIAALEKVHAETDEPTPTPQLDPKPVVRSEPPAVAAIEPPASAIEAAAKEPEHLVPPALAAGIWPASAN